MPEALDLLKMFSFLSIEDKKAMVHKILMSDLQDRTLEEIYFQAIVNKNRTAMKLLAFKDKILY